MLGVVALLAAGVGVASRLTGSHAIIQAIPQPSTVGPSELASPSPAAVTSPSPSPSPSLSPSRSPATSKYPRSGPGTFRYAASGGPVLGQAGQIRRFRVAVESNLAMIDIEAVASQIDEALGDHRSWIASGTLRLQRVAGSAAYDFTIHLATSGTTRAMCTAGGVDGTMGYTSCRVGSHVVLNLDRWINSVPYYSKAGVPLAVYRTYMINHEVGHELGHGHERCPGSGRPAPVMEQQTLGLHGCTPNPWPYLNGSLYTGPPGSY
jgi:hypothetical protein